MAKNDNDKITVAEQLRKVPGRVDNTGLKEIKRAMALKQAMLGDVGDNPVDDGHALTEICREWYLAESARLSGKGG